MSNELQPNIIAVENDPAFAEMLMVMLKQLKLEAKWASSGKEAIAVIQNSRPDVLLLDLNLGGETSGWQVLGYMRKQYPDCDIPVIVTSAFTDLLNRSIGQAQHVHSFLAKPFALKDLKAALNSALLESVS